MIFDPAILINQQIVRVVDPDNDELLDIIRVELMPNGKDSGIGQRQARQIKWSCFKRASSFATTPSHIDLTTLKSVGPDSTTLEPIGPDGVEDGQEGYAHIGEDGSPHGGQAEDGQNQEEGLNA